MATAQHFAVLHPYFECSSASNQADGAELTGAVAARGTGLQPSTNQCTFQAGLVQHDVANGPKCALLFFPYCTYKAQPLLYTARSSACEIFEFCGMRKDLGFACT
jgi:hypothetical protein